MYRLRQAGQFRRILFLVDRRALGEQTLAALDTTELEGLLKFSQTYNVADMDTLKPEPEHRVQAAIVQSLVSQVPGEEDEARPTPGPYDLIIDEAHRGYVLDAELSEADLAFRDTGDYLSKYRGVLEHFDAVKVALTATPALHTAEIFGQSVFHYGYRRTRPAASAASTATPSPRGDDLDITWLREVRDEEDILTNPADFAAAIAGHLKTALAEIEALAEELEPDAAPVLEAAE
jgi:hypothetical protein